MGKAGNKTYIAFAVHDSFHTRRLQLPPHDDAPVWSANRLRHEERPSVALAEPDDGANLVELASGGDLVDFKSFRLDRSAAVEVLDELELVCANGRRCKYRRRARKNPRTKAKRRGKERTSVRKHPQVEGIPAKGELCRKNRLSEELKVKWSEKRTGKDNQLRPLSRCFGDGFEDES